MDFVFDTETTGLPAKRGYNFDDPCNLSSYESARLVSISWIVSQRHSPTRQATYIIKPEGFEIPPESTAIHGITHEFAMQNGVPLAVVWRELLEALCGCTNLVAHNIAFDYNILMSEAFRCGQLEVTDKLKSMTQTCTMRKGKDVMAIRKYPKLEALYEHLHGEKLVHAHDAQYDTLHCFRCFTKMFPFDRTVFFFGDRKVKLTEEQVDVVYEDATKHMIVIACAGSGKTVTMLCRIKHLLDQGADESSIMLTAFTRDAANDMKNKLFDILGYKPNITVNTIDSISKMFIEKNFNTRSSATLKNVSEYSFLFLQQIREDPSIIARYKYMFVDEFQDINDIQFEIIREFQKMGCIIFGVGDDAQNIYTFRGSNTKYILNFQNHFGINEDESRRCCLKYLSYNFRSTKHIIDLANAIVEKNTNSIPKVMHHGGSSDDGGVPQLRYFTKRHAMNAFVVQEIQRLLTDDGVVPHQIAVISPINQSLFMIEEMLTQKGVANVYLDGKSDVKTSKKPWHVSLCTIHKSKGLEWDAVFMIDVSDELMPKMKKDDAIDESRRLFYVGVTRARKHLHMLYTTLISDEPFVTRFLTEIDRTLYSASGVSAKCFSGVSDLDMGVDEKSVTKLIEKLDGRDYQYMKRHGIIPDISIQDLHSKRRKLSESFTYAPIIQTEDLYSDFGIFLEKYVCREMALQMQNPSLCTDKHAIMCLANVKMDPDENRVFLQYKNNFKRNMEHVTSYIRHARQNKAIIKKALEQNSKFINPCHMDDIISILQKVYESSCKYGVHPTKVPIFSSNFLPPGFEHVMEAALKMFMDLNTMQTLSSDEEVDQNALNVWEVAKCQKIVTEFRRRLLYKQPSIAREIIRHYMPLFSTIRSNIAPFLQNIVKNQSDVIAFAEDMNIDDHGGIHGELDMRMGDTIIDIKTSISDELQVQWILQLLCYKVLCEHGKSRAKVNTIAVLNPLRGWYVDIDVSLWDKHHELVKYLIDKRDGFDPASSG